MLWFFIALLGYFLLAIVFVLDKLILTKSVERPVVYTFYSTIFMFGALLILPFGGGLLSGIDWVWATVSGLGFGFGLWAMFTALKYGETSHISPFIGVIITVTTFALSYALFGERLGQLQIVGIVTLLFAGLLLSFEKTAGSQKKIYLGFVWAIIAGLLFAVSHVAAKHIYEVYDFITGFAWTRATTGIVGLVTLAFPCVIRSCSRGMKKKRKKEPKTYAKRHALGIVVSDKVLGVVGVVLIQYAIAVGSVTLVNAMSGLQYVLMFLIILFSTKFFPKVFKEYFTKKEKSIQWIALCLVVVGSALFVL